MAKLSKIAPKVGGGGKLSASSRGGVMTRRLCIVFSVALAIAAQGTVRNWTGGGDGVTFADLRNWDGTVQAGDALVIENCGYPNGAPAVSITGGTFVSSHAQSVASYAYNKDETTSYEPVSGFISPDGTALFSDADADGVPAGYELAAVEGTDPTMYAVSYQALT